MSGFRISFFKLNRHKQFEYKPLYYNEAKEELKHRIETIKRENGIDSEAAVNSKARMQQSIREKWNRKNYKESVSRSNRRVIIIIAVLLLISYFLFK